jgi:energy-coupling factor transporter ATP-binding protein EcfA2
MDGPRANQRLRVTTMALAARNLEFAWRGNEGEIKAVSGFSAEFPGGVPHFICGPSGSGKTTLGYLLSGLTTPDSGNVSLQADAACERSSIAYVFQFAEDLFFEDTVAAELKQIADGREERAREVFAQLGISLSEILASQPHRLSAGYARLVAVAMQMARDPQVLILDEPTIGLDWRFHRSMTAALRDWLSPSRVLIVITHDLDLMRELGGQAWVISGGRLAWSGNVAALLAASSLLEQFALRF